MRSGTYLVADLGEVVCACLEGICDVRLAFDLLGLLEALLEAGELGDVGLLHGLEEGGIEG